MKFFLKIHLVGMVIILGFFVIVKVPFFSIDPDLIVEYVPIILTYLGVGLFVFLFVKFIWDLITGKRVFLWWH